MLKSMDLYIFGTLVIILDCIITISLQATVAADHPQNATVDRGGNIELPCKFNDTISRCVWARNGTTININERYKYNNSDDNGTNTNDCTIVISGFSRIDATAWQCSCPATDNINKAEICMSNYAYLSMNSSDATEVEQMTSEIIWHPQNATVVVGGSILLQCKFNEVIGKCDWFRNGIILTIKDRYKYLNSDDNGENTKDCSIVINGFDEIDATRWQCTCAADSNKTCEECNSQPAYLTMNQSEITVNPLDNARLTNLQLYVVIGLILVGIMLLVAIYCCYLKKTKKKGNSKSPDILTEIPNNSLRHNSSSNLNKSRESICTVCHQQKPEECYPGDIWIAPGYDHRSSKFLPWPEVDENVPPYDKGNPRQDESSDQQYEEIPNSQSMDHYSSIDELQKQTQVI